MKFSIITINYNNREGLQKTINSVVSQTFKDYEWIIIDGGSSDGSKELIEKYSNHLAYWCSEPDKGVYNAMNKGIDHANGEYISFMNSGDTYNNENTLFDVANNILNADIIYGNWLTVYPDNTVFIQAPFDVDLSYIYKQNICHQAMFIKRSFQNKEKYDERYKILADWALWQKKTLEDCSFQYLPLTICRYDANGLSSIDSDIMRKEVKMTREIYSNRMLLLLEEHKKLKKELNYIGPRCRTLFEIKRNHSFFGIIMKICLSPAYIIALLFYKMNPNGN